MRLAMIILVVSLSFLGACTPKNEQEQAIVTKPSGVIPEYQKQALENAKNVEDVLKQAEQRRNDSSK